MRSLPQFNILRIAYLVGTLRRFSHWLQWNTTQYYRPSTTEFCLSQEWRLQTWIKNPRSSVGVVVVINAEIESDNLCSSWRDVFARISKYMVCNSSGKYIRLYRSNSVAIFSANFCLHRKCVVVEARSYGGDTSTGKRLVIFRKTDSRLHSAYGYSIGDPNSRRRVALVFKFVRSSLYTVGAVVVWWGRRERGGEESGKSSPKRERKKKRRKDKKGWNIYFRLLFFWATHTEKHVW